MALFAVPVYGMTGAIHLPSCLGEGRSSSEELYMAFLPLNNLPVWYASVLLYFKVVLFALGFDTAASKCVFV